MTGGPTFGVGRIRWGWFIVGSVVVLLLPAVTGTGNATTSIKTGQMLRVNGSTGEVTILS